MKSSVTFATAALILAVSTGTAAAATPLENFEANYPVVQPVPGEAPEKGYTLSPNDPSWPQLPKTESRNNSDKMESLRGRNLDASDTKYYA